MCIRDRARARGRGRGRRRDLAHLVGEAPRPSSRGGARGDRAAGRRHDAPREDRRRHRRAGEPADSKTARRPGERFQAHEIGKGKKKGPGGRTAAETVGRVRQVLCLTI